MKLTKRKISKLLKNKNQSYKKIKRPHKKSKEINKTFRKKKAFNLSNRTIKNFLYSGGAGGDYDADDDNYKHYIETPESDDITPLTDNVGRNDFNKDIVELKDTSNYDNTINENNIPEFKNGELIEDNMRENISDTNKKQNDEPHVHFNESSNDNNMSLNNNNTPPNNENDAPINIDEFESIKDNNEPVTNNGVTPKNDSDPPLNSDEFEAINDNNYRKPTMNNGITNTPFNPNDFKSINNNEEPVVNYNNSNPINTNETPVINDNNLVVDNNKSPQNIQINDNNIKPVKPIKPMKPSNNINKPKNNDYITNNSNDINKSLHTIIDYVSDKIADKITKRITLNISNNNNNEMQNGFRSVKAATNILANDALVGGKNNKTQKRRDI